MRTSTAGRGIRVALAVTALVLLGHEVADAQGAAKDASKAFASGSRLFEQGDYDKAIAAFKLAYQLKPHYLVRCNLALCHEQKKDYLSAAAEFRACLREGAAKSASAEQVKKSLAAVEKRIAWVSVHSPGLGGVVYVDGSKVGDAPLRVAINPGSHRIEVRRDGARPASTTVQGRAGEQLAVELVPIPRATFTQRKTTPITDEGLLDDGETERDDDRGISQVWFWSAVGVTAALAVTATVLGVQTLQLKTEFEDNPTQERYDRGTSRRLATNLVLAGAVAAGASATLLFFYTDFSGRAPRDATATTVGLGIRGTF